MCFYCLKLDNDLMTAFQSNEAIYLYDSMHLRISDGLKRQLTVLHERRVIRACWVQSQREAIVM